jgi:uncharacterized phiE125 gp8 family phage protein
MAQKYSLKRTVAPAVEPVSLSEARDQLRISTNDDDTILAANIVAARQAVERDTRRALITQTWRLKLDEFPKKAIRLPYSPLQSVTSITYVPDGGGTTTWSASEYDVFTDDEPGLICPVFGDDWPEIRLEKRGITVTYVAGYGDSATDVPAELRQAVLLQVEMLYDGRPMFGTTSPIVEAYRSIVQAATVSEYP